MTVLLGVDGRRGGWAVAAVTVGADRVSTLRWHTVHGQDPAGFAAVLALADRSGAAAIGVDCPIGLPADRWRECDLTAKARLGRGSARVFLAPPRPVLTAPTYGDARVIARHLLAGKGISAQTYGIRRVVLAVDGTLTGPDGAAWVERLLEVHPELSFMAMTGRGPGDPLPSKRIPAGRAARIAALSDWCGGLALDPPDGDDHLDALAAAWSAWRWTRGDAEVLGGAPDEHGLPMRIVI